MSSSPRLPRRRRVHPMVRPGTAAPAGRPRQGTRRARVELQGRGAPAGRSSEMDGDGAAQRPAGEARTGLTTLHAAAGTSSSIQQYNALHGWLMSSSRDDGTFQFRCTTHLSMLDDQKRKCGGQCSACGAAWTCHSCKLVRSATSSPRADLKMHACNPSMRGIKVNLRLAPSQNI